MKINTEFLEDHQAKIQVEVDPEPFEDAKLRAARRIASKSKIPGFRPGKAPYPVVVRYIGEPVILEEAIEILIDELYPKAIEEAKISPYGPGTLEDFKLDPPMLKFLIPLSPTVELGDYRSIRIPYECPSVSDEEIDEAITELRERQVVYEPVDRPAQEGDQVYIQLSAIRLNPKEGQNAEFINKRDSSITIKPKKSDEAEFPYIGFSRNLIGMSVGDEKTFSYTYPKKGLYKDLAGVKAEFYVKVDEIKARILPELDDVFAQSIGEFSTYDEFYNAVKNSLEEQAKEEYNEDYDNRVLNEVISISKIKYPPQMLEHEIDRAIDNLNERLLQQHMDIDLYLKTRNIDMAKLKEELLPSTETKIKKSLILMEINEKEKIDIDQDELSQATTRTIDAIYQNWPKEKAQKYLSNQESMSYIVSNIMMDMLTQKTIEKLRSIASGQEEKLEEEKKEEAVEVTEIAETSSPSEDAQAS